jgi:hypothetical protein
MAKKTPVVTPKPGWIGDVIVKASKLHRGYISPANVLTMEELYALEVADRTYTAERGYCINGQFLTHIQNAATKLAKG